MYWKVPTIVPSPVRGSDIVGSEPEGESAPIKAFGAFASPKSMSFCAVLCEHDVAGFQVTMHHAVAVGFLQTLADFFSDS